MKLTSKKIVIIEDEPLLLEILVDIFLAENWWVETATNGLTGLDKIKDFKPDVIVSDIKMPYLDGLKMLEILYEQNCDIPVIFLSGYRDTDKMRKAWSACAFEFLDKPFSKNKLLEICQNAYDCGKDYVKIARRRYEKILASKNKTVA